MKKRAKIQDYLWRDGFASKGVNAKAAASELDRLAKEHGGALKSVAVVQAAKAKTSALHPMFEWDDSKAAERYRKHQAGQIMTSLIVVYEGAGGKSVEVPYLVSYTPPENAAEGNRAERSYVNIERVKDDATMRAAVVDRAWEELISWQSRYEHLSEFLEVRRVINKVRSAA